MFSLNEALNDNWQMFELFPHGKWYIYILSIMVIFCYTSIDTLVNNSTSKTLRTGLGFKRKIQVNN